MLHMDNVTWMVPVALLVSGLVTYFATPAVKRLAQRVGAMDIPRDERRMHKKPIPRMGGLAIYAGFLVGACLFGVLNRQLGAMLLGGTLIVVVGALDDKFSLKAIYKLVAQIGAALVAVWGGHVISYISNPIALSEGSYLYLGIFAVPVTVIWIVTITNAVNLIDGLDGLAVGVSGISSLTMMGIALAMGNAQVAVLMAALLGGCLGFLPFNRNPASIFMGDTGSTFLGYVLAVMSVQGLFKLYSLISIVVPFVVLGVPIFDITFAVVRRISRGQSPMQADRGHVHHRLIDRGLSQKQAVVVLYAVSTVLGICAVLMATNVLGRVLTLVLAVLAAGLIAWGLYRPGVCDREEKGNRQDAPRQEE